MSDFLLEIYMENLPLGAGGKIYDQLRCGLKDRFEKDNVLPLYGNTDNDPVTSAPKLLNNPKVYRVIYGGHTCNRIVVIIQHLPHSTRESCVRIKGPKVDASQQAITGFVRKHNLKEQRSLPIEDGRFYFDQIIPSVSLFAWLQCVLPEVIVKSLPHEQSMRWENHQITAPRPIRNILCLLDDKIIPFNLAGVQTTNTTYRNEISDKLSPVIDSWKTYYLFLHGAGICPDYNMRLTNIRQQCDLPDVINWEVPENNSWLHYHADTSEQPLVIKWHLDSDLPQDMIKLILYEKQKCLWVADKKLSLFVIPKHLESKKDKIIERYKLNSERRIKDVEYVLHKDLHSSWRELQDHWLRISIHPKLGNVQDKVTRMQGALEELVELLWQDDANRKYLQQVLPCVPWGDRKKRSEWLLVCLYIHKIDAGMAISKELTDMQGQGGYYLIAKKPELISELFGALSFEKSNIELMKYLHDEQFLQDRQYWQALINIVDVLDTLTGFWYHGIMPTGSQDPFAQRRKANNLIDYILQFPLYLALSDMIRVAIKQHDNNILANDIRILEWVRFVQDRVLSGVVKRKAKWYWRVSRIFMRKTADNNLIPDKIKREDNLLLLFHQLHLHLEMENENEQFHEAMKRMRNILKQHAGTWDMIDIDTIAHTDWFKQNDAAEDGTLSQWLNSMQIIRTLKTHVFPQFRQRIIFTQDFYNLPKSQTVFLWFFSIKEPKDIMKGVKSLPSMRADQSWGIMLKLLKHLLGQVYIVLDRDRMDDPDKKMKAFKFTQLSETNNLLNFALGIDKKSIDEQF